MGKLSISSLVRIAGLVASLSVLGFYIDYTTLFESIQSVPWEVSVLALGIAVTRLYLSALRWKVLSPDAVGLSQWQCFRLILGSGSLNLFLPGTVGGDVARSFLAMREATSQRGSAFISVIADRLVGLLSILFLGLIACTLSPLIQDRWLYFAFFTLIGVSLLISFSVLRSLSLQNFVRTLLQNRKTKAYQSLSRKVDRFLGVVRDYEISSKKVWVAFALCFPIHVLWFLLVYLIALALDIEITFFAVTTVTTLVWIITTVPVSIGGIGVRELGYAFLLSLQGVNSEEAVALALYQSAVIIVLAVLGMPFLWIGRSRKS